MKRRINWNVPYGGGERSGNLRIWLTEWGFHSSGMIFSQNIKGNWRLSGVGSMGQNMRSRACEDKVCGKIRH